MSLEDGFDASFVKQPADGEAKKKYAAIAIVAILIVFAFTGSADEEAGVEEASDGATSASAGARVNCANPVAQAVLDTCAAAGGAASSAMRPPPPAAASLLPVPCPANLHWNSRQAAPCGGHGASCPLLIDVRTPAEWNDDGHASCGVLVPVQDDPTLNATVLALAGGDYSAPIVTHCYSGGRAGDAAAILTDAGFTDVTNGGGWSTGDAATIEANCPMGAGSTSWRWEPSRSIVSIPDGLVQGVTSPATRTREFYGIPYGASPTGERRFAAPVQNEPWSGVKIAQTKKSGCLRGGRRGPSGDEDCLYVNVHTPLDMCPPPGGFPVMVWYHGGCFTGGSPEGYDGSTIIAESGYDVIVVTVGANSQPFLTLLGTVWAPFLWS